MSLVSAQRRKRALRTTLDTGALITAARFSIKGSLVVDHLLIKCRINILPEVKHEAVDVGLQFGYPDAIELEQRVTGGNIGVLPSPVRSAPLESVLKKVGQEDADRALLQACSRGGKQMRLVTDDHRLFVTAIRLGLSPLFLPDLVLLLVAGERMAVSVGREILTAIQPRSSKGFIELSLRRLEGVI